MEKKAIHKQRIYYIDFLKCAGLLLIIFAHIGAPALPSAVRTFDVPLMVVVSSILSARSYSTRKQDKALPLQYLLQRIRRLVIPTWILLVIYFILQYLLTKKTYTVGYYLSSFALTRYGAGYVWIILIYLYSAVLVPLFSRLKPSAKAVLSVLFVYALYETVCYFRLGAENKFIDTLFYYIVPYGCLSFFGYNYEKFSCKAKKLLILLSFAVFSCTAAVMWYKTGSVPSPGTAKYPPQLYYMSYGFFVSFLLVFLCEKHKDLRLFSNRGVQYISAHSLWIYLWHIIALLLYKTYNLPEIWYLKFLVITLSSILFTFLVNKFLDFIERKKKYPFLRYFRG